MNKEFECIIEIPTLTIPYQFGHRDKYILTIPYQFEHRDKYTLAIAPGTYFVKGAATGISVDNHQIGFYNVSDSVMEFIWERVHMLVLLSHQRLYLL